MTKRFSNLEARNNKKPKLDDDIEALWGDEVLDEDALEDCIKLATQTCNEENTTGTQLNNASILPTYHGFKDPNAIFSSTQFNNSAGPSTSKVHDKNESQNLEQQIKRLQEQYNEKEGEVAILRSQLRETKTIVHTEQQKTQNEWRQKLLITERQMKSAKSELEFKNLEIANLKQKILDIHKHNQLENTFNATQSITVLNVKTDSKVTTVTTVPELKVKSGKIYALLEPVYPLKGIITETCVDILRKEKHSISTKLTQSYRNPGTPYMETQVMVTPVAVDKSELNINYIYPDILELMKCTAEELNLLENNTHINKILCVSLQLLTDLLKFLDTLKTNLITEELLEADSNYLKSSSSDTYLNEQSGESDDIGLQAGVALNCVAELLLYNDYLAEYICQEKCLFFKEQELHLKQIPCIANQRRDLEPHCFLNTLLKTLQIIGDTRKANVMSKFLCAAVKLLINITKSRNYNYVCDIFCRLTHELILMRPPVQVICQLTSLFKVASPHSSFVEFLLNKSETPTKSKKGVLYFNEGACRFYVFVMIFDNTIFKLRNEDFPLNVSLNMLSFMYNTFKSTHWIHHRNINECECLPQLYKLEIEIVFRTLELYTEDIKRTKHKTSKWEYFFKNPIAVKVLSLMTFNSFETTEKYVNVFSQYKELEKRLEESEELISLEKLNIIEETIEVPSDKFANIL